METGQALSNGGSVLLVDKNDLQFVHGFFAEVEEAGIGSCHNLRVP